MPVINPPLSASSVLLQAQALAHVRAPITVSAVPTVTFAASAMGGAVNYPGWKTSANAPNNVFGIYGAKDLRQRATPYPYSDIVNAAPSNANTLAATEVTACFYHYGAALDVIQFGSSMSVNLWVDDVWVGHYESAITTGTAQAGGVNTITLAVGSAAANGYYIQCWARITSGTGVGQIAQITGYVGSTKVATVASNWTTPPDATSVYSIETNNAGFVLDGNTGSVKYLHLAWATTAARKITVVQGNFMGVNIGTNDSIWAGPPVGSIPWLVVGDSLWEGAGGPWTCAPMIHQLGRLLGVQPYNLASGGSGWMNGSTSRFRFLDRIAPPPEAWRLTPTATGGTFTLSVTYGGSTQTTGALAFNASGTTVQTAIAALSNVPANASAVARGDLGTPWIVLLTGMTGATLAVGTGSLTGGTVTQSAYLGDVAINQPRDVNGNPLPFVLFVPGSGNDGSFSDAQVQAAATAGAQAITARFPTAIPIFTGVLSVADGGGSGTISATDLSRNAAIKAAAGLLPKINGQTPYIETYENGLAGNCWVFGSGSIGVPTAGKNDIFKSLLAAGHPTGDGHVMIAARVGQKMKALLGLN